MSSAPDPAPLPALTHRFFEALRHHRPEEARQILERTPAIAHTSVFAAAVAGDAEFLASELKRDPSLAAAVDDQRWSALLYAGGSPLHATDPARAAGILECARLLLDAGADPNSHMLYDPEDPTSKVAVLYFAVMSDHVAMVKLLLERGADPNDGESVYHGAEWDRVDCLELLLAHGADLGSRHEHWNNTPLYFISGYRPNDPHTPRAIRGMKWLLEHGADPNVTSYAHRETPLHTLARGGHAAETLEMFIAHGADVNAARADGKTPLVLALRAGAAETAATLRKHGATETNVTPADELVTACMAGDEARARAVLARHPDLMSSLTPEDRQALAQAGTEDRVKSVRLMASLGFPVDQEAAEPGTPLHHAAWHGRAAVVRTLLEMGAPLDFRDREFGSSPLGWASHGSANCRTADDDYLAVVDLLLDAGSAREPSFNRWGAPPEALASARVAAHLKERGFGA